METVLIIGGVVASLLVEFLKKQFNVSGKATLALVALVALVGAVAYKVLLAYGLWDAFLGVLITAGAFYAFIIKNIGTESEV